MVMVVRVMGTFRCVTVTVGVVMATVISTALRTYSTGSSSRVGGGGDP